MNTPPSACVSLGSIFYVDGTISDIPTRFLLDTGAAMSVVCWDALPEEHQSQVVSVHSQAVGANGLPLDIMGQVQLPISIGTFDCKQSFLVVRKLTVLCLLGADFLRDQAAIINCKESRLSLGAENQCHVLIDTGRARRAAEPSSLTVIATVDFEVPGGTLQLATGSIKEDAGTIQEGLFEPISGKLPKHVSMARSMNCVTSDKQMVLQVMNTSPSPVTVYKGTVLGIFVPSQYVLVVGEGESLVPQGTTNGSVLPDLNATCKHLSDSEKVQLNRLLVSYEDLFVSKGDPLGRTDRVKHSIRVEGPPIRQPLRRTPRALKEVVDAETQKMLKEGVIRESNSPWSSPVVLVQKKDGSWRFCVDYRKLNSLTHRDAYPLPRIDETLDTLGGSKFFTTLDLASGYWQLEIEEADKEKTAFSTRQGHFKFNVMPFGLTNAPATFQRLMECLLAGLSPEQCMIYLDDIIVFSSSVEQHLQRLDRILSRIRAAGLKLQAKKCCFVQEQVRYLGHVISAEGIRPDESKVQAVATYPVPKDVKQLRQFLGLANYYRRFVRGYSELAAPLHILLRKEKKFLWSPEAQKAFDKLKYCLITPPVLSFPDFTQEFIVHTDASDTAIGGVLSQVQDGHERVISYWSRQLQKSERRYSTIEREALAVVSAVKEFYPYLYGFTFTLVTDHNPLTALKGLKDVGGRLSRWLLFLQQFQYRIVYRPGKHHTNADALSRIPAPETLVTAVQNFLPSYSPNQLRSAQMDDAQLKPIMEALERQMAMPLDTPPGLQRAQLHNGVLCRQYKKCSSQEEFTQFVVPTSLREVACRQVHDCSGHLGINKTMERLKERFYWPGYESDIKDWLQGCELCQRRNPPQPSPRAPLGRISACQPFEKVSWDIMGPLPVSSKGNKYILVITDLFTKWVEAFPIRSTNTETLATILVNEIVCRYGVPRYLHSDQGANLTSRIIQSLCKKLGIQRTQTSAYHPQGNAQVERFNRTLEAMLSKTVKENQKDWDQQLPRALFAYRTAVHEATGYSPYRVNFGRSPALPVDVMLGLDSLSEEEGKAVPEYVDDIGKSLQTMFGDIKQRLAEAHRQNKVRYDKKVAGKNFTIGDRVWLYIPVTREGRTKKFTTFWRGPYTVVDKIGTYNYRVQLIGTTRTLIVHRNRLKLCYGEPDHTMCTQGDTPIRDTQDSEDTQASGPDAQQDPVETSGPPAIPATGGYTDTSQPQDDVADLEMEHVQDVDDCEPQSTLPAAATPVDQELGTEPDRPRSRSQRERRRPDFGPFVSH